MLTLLTVARTVHAAHRIRSMPVVIAVLAAIGLAAYVADTMVAVTAAVDFGGLRERGRSV